jgi:hypothetical protein
MHKTPSQFFTSLLSKKLLTTLMACIAAYSQIPDTTLRWQTIAGIVVAYLLGQSYVDGQTSSGLTSIGPAITNTNVAPTVHDPAVP